MKIDKNDVESSETRQKRGKARGERGKSKEKENMKVPVHNEVRGDRNLINAR